VERDAALARAEIIRTFESCPSAQKWWTWPRCGQVRRRAQRQATEQIIRIGDSRSKCLVSQADMAAARPCPPAAGGFFLLYSENAEHSTFNAQH
jgi:hypothetical protein